MAKIIVIKSINKVEFVKIILVMLIAFYFIKLKYCYLKRLKIAIY